MNAESRFDLPLPEDLSTEANVRELIDASDLGKRALERLESVCADIYRLIHQRVKAHAGYQAVHKENRWNSLLTGTPFTAKGYFDHMSVNGDTVTMHLIVQGRYGDSDEHFRQNIPLEWLWMPTAQLTGLLDAQLDAVMAKHEQAKRDSAARALVNEKAQLAALLCKHGTPSPQETGSPKGDQ